MTPSVRLATTADAELCLEYEAQARRAIDGARGAEAMLATYPNGFLLPGHDGWSLVAEVDSVVVGFATVHMDRTTRPPAAVLTRIYVTPAARKVGIGDALIAGVRSTARDRGCVRMDAVSLPGDRDTKNLYERNGLTARLIVAASAL